MSPAPDPNPPEPPAVTTPGQYEFSEAENRVIDELADTLTWVRLPLLILVVAYALSSIGHFVRAGRDAAELVPAGLAIIGAVFYFLLANWLRKAGEAFTRVTHTRGHDIAHLMNALRQLRRTFGLLAAVVQVFILLFFAFLITALVIAIVRGDW